MYAKKKDGEVVGGGGVKPVVGGAGADRGAEFKKTAQ